MAPGLNITQMNLNGQTSFQARVASAGAGGSIQIRLDGTNGTLIGTCTVPHREVKHYVDDGELFPKAVPAVIITHLSWCSPEAVDICSILKWFAFQPQANGIEAARYNSSSVGVQTENCNEGVAWTWGFIQNSARLEYNQLNLNGQTSFQARVARRQVRGQHPNSSGWHEWNLGLGLARFR